MHPEMDSPLCCGRTVHTPEGQRDAAALPFNAHPAFEGVCLKHLLGGQDTGGALSCHVVRVAPGKALLRHIHDGQWELHEVVAGSGTAVIDGADVTYAPGVTAVIPKGLPHAVTAGPDGLVLFAKFFPALL